MPRSVPLALASPHAELVSGDPSRGAAALARVLALPRPRMTEARRYRALVVARAAACCPDLTLVEAAAAGLASERDARARDLGAWVRAWHALPLTPEERADDVRRAAALAGRHGLPDLGARIEARAAALAQRDRGAAYR